MGGASAADTASSPRSERRQWIWHRRSSRHSATRSSVVGASPTLHTSRLVLGPFTPVDAADLQQLAGNREIADTTVSIPHPYALDHALAWIGQQRRELVRGRATNFAVRLLPGSP